jgi:hypothetical protein
MSLTLNPKSQSRSTMLLHIRAHTLCYMSDYESRRAQKIAQHQALMKGLQLVHAGATLKRESPYTSPEKSSKRKKITNTITKQPSRASARIASTSIRSTYNKDDKSINIVIPKQDSLQGKSAKGFTPPASAKRTTKALEDLQAS